MNDALNALENQYFTVRDSLSPMTAQGATPAQVNQLRGLIVTARNNYWTSINKVLHDDDPAVESLVTQMGQQQLALQASLGHLSDVAKALNVITEAVDVGSLLAAKAIAL